jgi:hypothetical protein
MFKGIKSVLNPTEGVQVPSNAGYQVIRGGSEEDEGLEGSEEVLERDDGRGVYLAFWALGAGVLLSWNGGCLLSDPSSTLGKRRMKS